MIYIMIYIMWFLLFYIASFITTAYVYTYCPNLIKQIKNHRLFAKTEKTDDQLENCTSEKKVL